MPNTPFLCHFIDRVIDKSNRNPSIDFKEILVDKLGFFSKNHHYSDKCVLILSADFDPEADIVCIELLRRGIDYLRLNVEDVPRTLSITNRIEQNSDTESQFRFDSLISNPANISAVYLRNFDYGLIHSNSNDLETAFIFQQWNDALQILLGTLKYPWINSLDATLRTNNRIIQFDHAKRAGFKIPSTIITNSPEHARSFYREHDGDIIVKVLHHHDLDIKNKIYSIYSHRVTNEDLSKLDDLTYAPCILQKRIHILSELRVTVVRDKVFSLQLGTDNPAFICDDIHRIPLSKIPKKSIQLRKEIEIRCTKLINSLGLDYGAIDLVIDEDGNLFFLEVNPTGDWLWVERETKLPITKAIVDLIESIVMAST